MTNMQTWGLNEERLLGSNWFLWNRRLELKLLEKGNVAFGEQKIKGADVAFGPLERKEIRKERQSLKVKLGIRNVEL